MNIEEENVNVVVRIRPMQANEKKNGDVPCVKGEKSGKEVQVKVGPLDAQVYRCHRCFDPNTTQSDFFQECGITDLLDSAMQGYRGCAFAFGQTGAGKTFTMVGASKGVSHRDKQVGLIARSLEYLCSKLEASGTKFRLKISCLEIYHENVYDLFTEEKERQSLAVREHASEGFFLEGARLIECKDYEVACAALDIAIKNRQVGGHDLNSRSSRSHCMTEIHIDTSPTNKKPSPANRLSSTLNGEEEHYLYRGKMTLVDLAGSERLKDTNSTGKVLQEAGFINRSLYVLGKVIAGLVRTNGDLNHKDVPFRDSKLTKLLISSLGGNSRTLLVACVSEAKGSQAETLRTLKFSMSCARIRNKPVKFLDPQEKLIVDLRDEIRRLRRENKVLRSNLVTAPASSEPTLELSIKKMQSEKDEEFARASSAREFDDRSRDAAHRASNKKLSSGSRIKKKPATTRKKQPEIFYKYPQLHSILKDDSKTKRSSDKIIQKTDKKAARQSLVGEESSTSLLVDTEDDLDSVQSMQSGVSRSKQRTDILDEMVHRKAAGPLIFKDRDSPIPSLRESRLQHYYPAENNVRQMDAKRQELQLLQQQQKELQELQRQQENEVQQASIVVNGSQFVKKKNKGKKAPPVKEKKASPYLVPLIKDEKKKAKEKPKDSLPQIDPSHPGGEQVPAEQLQRVKSKHHPIVKALKKNDDGLAGDHGIPSRPRGIAINDRKQVDDKIPHKHHSLPELPLASRAPNGLPSRVSPRAAGAPLPRIKISDMPSDSELRQVLRASVTEPVLKTETSLGGNDSKSIHSQRDHHREDAGPLKSGTSLDIVVDSEPERELEAITAAQQDDDDYGYEFELDDDDEKRSEIHAATTTPERLTKKLEKLENSLVLKRMQMEDSPGHVTSEVEEKYQHLQQEAKAIRVELAAITGEISPSKRRMDVAEDEDAYDNEIFLDEDHAMTVTHDQVHAPPNPAPPTEKSQHCSHEVLASPPSKNSPSVESPPSIANDEEMHKLWFVREKNLDAHAEVAELPPSLSHEQRHTSQRFKDVIGRSYDEELGMLTRSITSQSGQDIAFHNHSDDHGDNHLKSSSFEHPTTVPEVPSVTNLRPETANEYGEDEFDYFEDNEKSSGNKDSDQTTENPSSEEPDQATDPLLSSIIKSTPIDTAQTTNDGVLPHQLSNEPIGAVSSAVEVHHEEEDYGNDDFDEFEDN